MKSLREMNSYEIVMACIAGEKTDRPPVIPIVREWACKQAGIKFFEAMNSVEKYVYAQHYCVRKFGYDAVFDLSGVHAESEAMGSVIRYGESLLPTVEKFAVKDYDKDLAKLKILNPNKDGRLPMILEGITRLKKLCDNEIPVIGYAQGPFRSCTMLRGTEKWMRDIYKDKENAKKLLEIALDSQIAWGIAVAQAGADIITIADPPSSGSVISSKTFSEWSLPYLKKMCRTLKKTGVKMYLHICGDISDRLELLASIGADILQVDSKVDLDLVRRTLGPDLVLMGNIDPSNPLALGTPEEVYEQSKKAIETAGKEGGFFLSGGCMISEEVPASNIEAMIRAGYETDF